jgi:hypothetical protein
MCARWPLSALSKTYFCKFLWIARPGGYAAGGRQTCSRRHSEAPMASPRFPVAYLLAGAGLVFSLYHPL